jgi:serine/threonine protein kinase
LTAISEIVIPSTVTRIDDLCFANCKELQTVAIGKNSKLQHIGCDAFDGCHILALFLPSGVEFVDGTALHSFASFTLDEENPNYKWQDSILCDRWQLTLVLSQSSRNYAHIPRLIQTIGSYCFANHQQLTEVIFEPNNVLRCISQYAFTGTMLQQIVIPRTVQLVAEHSFENCISLTKLIFESNSELRRIESYAFSNCGIVEIELPRRIQVLDEYCFVNCANLRRLLFLMPSELEVIQLHAFFGTSLMNVSLPLPADKFPKVAFPEDCQLDSVINEGWGNIKNGIVDLDDYELVKDVVPSHISLYRSRTTSSYFVMKSARIPFAMKHKHNLEDLLIRENESFRVLHGHPCIVPFVGYSLPNERSKTMIVTEYMPNGSLEDVLESNPHPEWWTPTAKCIAIYGLVRGMKFVHFHQILHRDLNPRSLLFDSCYHLRINDFQTIRMNSSRSLLTQEIGTPRYTAPEICIDDEYRSSVDVFSFSCILYEILCDHPVFEPTFHRLALMKAVLRGDRNMIPTELPDWISELIEECWASVPIRRPSFALIDRRIREHNFEMCKDVDCKKVREFASEIDAMVAQSDCQGNPIDF